jgi:glycosyltransferase involved in cell wall biosynthesis
MVYLYLTADRIGEWTGGGSVTRHEWTAFADLARSLGKEARKLELTDLDNPSPEPWKWDQRAAELIDAISDIELCHIYSGTFSETVKKLKDRGAIVTYSVVAHDKDISRFESERYLGTFPYPHLVEPDLWKRYIEGYRLADLIFCPGSVPAGIVAAYTPDFRSKRYKIIPHGCELPSEVKPLPEYFTCGYLGAVGTDKGLVHLLEAWKRLNYKNAVLMLGGMGFLHPAMYEMIRHYGGGSISILGWVENKTDFFDNLSIYVQPSSTEGFGIPVLEAMAHGRLALCSTGAGAVDIIPNDCVISAMNSRDIASSIDRLKQRLKDKEYGRQRATEVYSIAVKHTWERIRKQYMDTWKQLLEERKTK